MTKTDRTVAKIGRSMKKCDRFTAVPRSRLRGRLDLARLRRDLAAGPGPPQPVDDDAVGRREARADDAEAVIGHRTGTHDLGLDRAVILHGHHHFAGLIGDDGAVGNEDRVVALRGRDADPPELSRGYEEIGVREGSAGADRPGAAIYLIVDKVEQAPARPLRLVGKPHIDGRAVARLVKLPGRRGPLIGKVIALAHVEIEIDRVERYDRR